MFDAQRISLLVHNELTA
ncbi:hypothetical protein LY16_02859 [Xenorhabdus doucetiae]|uniref:Uncharacterized protein n=1 Tax=Xenorhabdus doucetiae TaxID=351671 RepID=A0ABY3NP70_9GAMM|nr:hypothetical protein LY16_02859 [Xenorhabdus doucetiae]